MSRTVPEIAGIKAYDPTGIDELIKELGLPAFRSKQLKEWIYGKNAASYEEMTNLPKAMRERLAKDYPLLRAEIETVTKSKD